MSVLNTMLKYIGYYIVMMVVASLFTSATTQMVLTRLCGATLSIAMFLSVIELLLDGKAGVIAHHISEWCVKFSIIIVLISVISGIGVVNILRLSKPI